ncbi:DUF4352 domain-containing protein [Paraliobacillus sediminis]|uniref:DUF4352 domain-containing protein n=1 Tax=Paraliobacillus sediminis TaxID=1885916 RepID=UPI000E3CDAA7|nr:DUF4352 domain-containing protein [Paraliobacillus sediminis]
MKNLIKLMVIGMVIAFVLVGCNNNDEANEISENQETEDTNEASETAGEGETDEAEGDESASDETDSSESEGEILSLGETGTSETVLGDFEVTPTAVRFLDEIKDGPYSEPHNDGVFAVVDVTLKNIDDEAIESSDITNVHIFGEDGDSVVSNPTFPTLENFEGEIAPGEEMSGQLLFDTGQSDSYKLVFGYGRSTVSNELTWEFTADEAE